MGKKIIGETRTKKRRSAESAIGEEEETLSDSKNAAKRSRELSVADEAEESIKTVRSLAFAFGKTKQLAARAFQEDLIDRLPRVVERESLIHAATLLDASVRIYSSRVDHTLSQAFEVRAKLGKEKAGETTENFAEEKHDEEQATLNVSLSGEDAGGFKDIAEAATADERNVDDEVFYERPWLASYRNASFKSVSDLTRRSTFSYNLKDDVTAESFLRQFLQSRGELVTKNCARREKLRCLCASADINDVVSEMLTVNSLYEKATRNLDEGSSRGLLMQNALIGLFGQAFILHECTENLADADVTDIEFTKLLVAYDCLLGMEQPNESHEHQKEGTDRLYLMEHEFNIVVRDMEEPCCENIIRCVDTLLDFAPLTSFSMALFCWRLRFQKVHNISASDFMHNLKACWRGKYVLSRKWYFSRTFNTSGIRLQFVDPRAVEGDAGIYTSAFPQMLSLFEKSSNWILSQQRKERGRSSPSFATVNEASFSSIFFARNGRYQCYEDGLKRANALFWSSNSPVKKMVFELTDLSLLVNILEKCGYDRNRGILSGYLKSQIACNLSTFTVVVPNLSGKPVQLFIGEVPAVSNSVDDLDEICLPTSWSDDDFIFQAPCKVADVEEKVLSRDCVSSRDLLQKSQCLSAGLTECILPSLAVETSHWHTPKTDDCKSQNANCSTQSRSTEQKEAVSAKSDKLVDRILKRRRDVNDNVVRTPVPQKRVTVSNYTHITLLGEQLKSHELPYDGAGRGALIGKNDVAPASFALQPDDCNLELTLYDGINSGADGSCGSSHHKENSLECDDNDIDEQLDEAEDLFAKTFGLTELTRQRRINAPLIKRAIKAALVDKKWCGSLKDTDCSTSGLELTDDIPLSFLLARIRFELMGSTDNFTVTDVFSSLLHVCNERNLKLIQERDEHGAILEESLGDVIIAQSFKGVED